MTDSIQNTPLTQEEIQKQRDSLYQELGKAYQAKLDNDMEKLHNQFVAFISVSHLPMTEVLLVLEILIKETIDQAIKKYMR
jgi:hypothetical protein